MCTSGPSRKITARKPSHFGSYSQRPLRGTSGCALASIGARGGAIGSVIRQGCPTDQWARGNLYGDDAGPYRSTGETQAEQIVDLDDARDRADGRFVTAD